MKYIYIIAFMILFRKNVKIHNILDPSKIHTILDGSKIHNILASKIRLYT